MSFICKQNKILGDTALIVLKHADGNVFIENIGDFKIIKVDQKIVGINIFNSSKYFEIEDGIHNINEKIIDVLTKNKINLKPEPFFLIGEVITKKEHPNSDKLLKLEVQTNKLIDIVTNDLSVKVGEKVIVAQLNVILPSGTIIKKSKVMGVWSEGMLCGGETLCKEPSRGVLRVEGINGEEFKL